MTDLSFGRHAANDHSFAVPGLSMVSRGLAAIAEFLVELRLAFVTGFQLQANYRKLAEMSDRQLADIGLIRDDIPETVVAPFRFQ